MKHLTTIVFFSAINLILFSQNNVNPLNNITIQQQVQMQMYNNVQANNINNDNNIFNKNDEAPKQQSENNCPDCDKIKQLKQQHSTSSYSYQPQRKQKKQIVKKGYHRFCKKMKRTFAKSKRTKPDYSCFNW
jgi:hypothetical protein